MTRTRSIFKFAYDDGLIEHPVKFGKGFEKPKREAIDRERQKQRQKNGERFFEAEEIRQLLAKASQPLKAMILLAVNCAYGQTDLANLPLSVINLETGWVDYARLKTSVERRAWLWPETVAAIREWLPIRPKAKNPDDSGLLFLTRLGARWVTYGNGSPEEKATNKDAVIQEFNKLLILLKLKRPRRSFYALRRVVETIGGETADQVAVDAVMGHRTPGMGEAYRVRIGDERLRRVAEHVRAWLFVR
jgi:integrase